jgi:hypothetical protein
MTSLTLTQHATTRMAQRGFRMSDLELITLIGTDTGDGYIVRTKDIQELENLLRDIIGGLHRVRDKRVVIVDGRLVTAYQPSKCERRRLLRRTYDADFD